MIIKKRIKNRQPTNQPSQASQPRWKKITFWLFFLLNDSRSMAFWFFLVFPTLITITLETENTEKNARYLNQNWSGSFFHSRVFIIINFNCHHHWSVGIRIFQLELQSWHATCMQLCHHHHLCHCRWWFLIWVLSLTKSTTNDDREKNQTVKFHISAVCVCDWGKFLNEKNPYGNKQIHQVNHFTWMFASFEHFCFQSSPSSFLEWKVFSEFFFFSFFQSNFRDNVDDVDDSLSNLIQTRWFIMNETLYIHFKKSKISIPQWCCWW